MRRPWQKSPDAPKRKAGRWLQREREQLFSDEPLCRLCREQGILRRAVERDHIKPIAEGGSEDRENTQPLCHEHNQERMRKQRGHRKRPVTGVDGWPLK
jgi:5-methylcytosine-specific restriction enzyme A